MKIKMLYKNVIYIKGCIICKKNVTYIVYDVK
jgi:hypothetical protein